MDFFLLGVDAARRSWRLICRMPSLCKNTNPMEIDRSFTSSVCSVSGLHPSQNIPQTCAGAKLSIFPHPFSLTSFPTTPVNLLPIGSPFFPINTHALSSNRTTLPSFRCNFFFVLTTTACRISPRRTLFAAETCAEEFDESDSGPKLR